MPLWDDDTVRFGEADATANLVQECRSRAQGGWQQDLLGQDPDRLTLAADDVVIVVEVCASFSCRARSPAASLAETSTGLHALPVRDVRQLPAAPTYAPEIEQVDATPLPSGEPDVAPSAHGGGPQGGTFQGTGVVTMRRRKPKTGGLMVPRPRKSRPGAPVTAKSEKGSAATQRASFATCQGAWISSPGNHHRAGAARGKSSQESQVMVKNILRFLGRFVRANKAVIGAGVRDPGRRHRRRSRRRADHLLRQYQKQRSTPSAVA